LQEGTLAQQVVQLAQQHAQQPQQPPPTLTVATSRRVPLEGDELQVPSHCMEGIP